MVKKKAAASEAARKPKLQLISIDDLRFDRENPRLADRTPARASQEQLKEALLSSPMDARELVPSFVANGFLPYDPLIVRPRGDGSYTVVEGNRRLAALRSMQASSDQDVAAAFTGHHLETVPCLVFEGSADQELAYLGLRHISKTKDWSSDAKAAFIERFLSAGHDIKKAASLTNTSLNGLKHLLLVRRLFERARELGLYIPHESAEGETLFWHLGDAVRRSRTKEYLRLVQDPDPLRQPELDESRFERLVTWIYGNPKTNQSRIIQSIRDIPELDSALGHPKSTEALEAGSSIAEALEEAEAAGSRVSSHLTRARLSVSRATASLADIARDGLQEVRDHRESLTKALAVFDQALSAMVDV